MAKVEAMSLMAVSSAKNITSAAKSKGMESVQGSSGSFGAFMDNRNQVSFSSQGQNPNEDIAVSSKTEFSVEQKPGYMKKKEYVADVNAADGSAVTPDAPVEAQVAQVAQITAEVRQIVKENLDVDDAELDQALSAMGITVFDLLDPNVLKDFVLQISGEEDPTALLLDEQLLGSFQTVLTALGDYAEEKKEPVLALMEAMEIPAPLEEVTDPETFAKVMKQITESLPEETQVVSVETSVVSDAGQTDTAPVVTTGTIAAETEAFQSPEESDQSGVSPAVTREFVESVSISSVQESEQGAMNQSQDSDQAGLMEGGSLEQTVLSEEVVPESEAEEAAEEFFPDRSRTDVSEEFHRTDEAPAPFVNGNAGIVQGRAGEVFTGNFDSSARMLQAIDIVHQISEQVRTAVTESTTRLEMQLNPESLGKVLLTVSAKEGVMTATFRVQSEEARQALESQMYTLRENLEAKNLKVDAVDVQISDFNFSESSEAERQMQEEMEKKARKGFDFQTAEDEADEVEASADAVRRQVMRDNGGSIDFTA